MSIVMYQKLLMFRHWLRTGERQVALCDVSLSRLLVRVGTVAEGQLLCSLDKLGLVLSRCVGDLVSRSVLAAEVVGNGGIVGGRVRESL
jgi:hypothetical protein